MFGERVRRTRHRNWLMFCNKNFFFLFLLFFFFFSIGFSRCSIVSVCAHRYGKKRRSECDDANDYISLQRFCRCDAVGWIVESANKSVRCKYIVIFRQKRDVMNVLNRRHKNDVRRRQFSFWINVKERTNERTVKKRQQLNRWKYTIGSTQKQHKGRQFHLTIISFFWLLFSLVRTHRFVLTIRRQSCCRFVIVETEQINVMYLFVLGNFRTRDENMWALNVLSPEKKALTLTSMHAFSHFPTSSAYLFFLFLFFSEISPTTVRCIRGKGLIYNCCGDTEKYKLFISPCGNIVSTVDSCFDSFHIDEIRISSRFMFVCVRVFVCKCVRASHVKMQDRKSNCLRWRKTVYGCRFGFCCSACKIIKSENLGKTTATASTFVHKHRHTLQLAFNDAEIHQNLHRPQPSTHKLKLHRLMPIMKIRRRWRGESKNFACKMNCFSHSLSITVRFMTNDIAHVCFSMAKTEREKRNRKNVSSSLAQVNLTCRK